MLLKFYKKLLLFILVIFITYAFGFVIDIMCIGNQNEGHYLASLVDKTNRLKEINKKKIILIGNSNVCFGFDSKMIEKAFDYEVVDMGLQGALGNAFLENMTRLGVNKGDIVVICHSTYADENNIINPDLAWITLEFNKDLWKIIRIKDVPALILSYPKYLFNSFVSKIGGSSGNIADDSTCYSRSAFNQYGDIEKRFNDRYIFSEGSIELPEINNTCIRRINDLNERLRRKGVTVLVAGYPIGFGKFTPDASEYVDFENELRSKLDCDVISHYIDYMMPYNLFYNTNLHLSEEGAKHRTELFISDLARWFKKG